MANNANGSGGLDGASSDELRYVQQVYQNQYAVATNSINMILQELQELNSAQKTLENVNLVEGKEALTSIGADTFFFSRVQSTKSVVMAVGGGYLVEKAIDSAKERTAKLIQVRTDRLNRIVKNRKELEAALIEISYRLGSTR
ncbi:MAG: prefoldin subunit alpha [Candidatus Micrarchaeaceae archaeon]|jgi:prefoldin alpha subunit